MSEPYIGEIRIFANNFAPVGWFRCNGTTLEIAEFQELFGVIGTIYGGNGTSNFKLPNLIMPSQYPYGRAPGGTGCGPGFTDYILGHSFGEDAVPIVQEKYLPPHNHLLYGIVPVPAETTNTPSTSVKIARYLQGGTVTNRVYSDGNMTSVMAEETLAATGAAQPHENCQPFLSLGFYIAYDGVFPVPD